MRITKNKIIEYLRNDEEEYAPLQVEHIEKQAHLSEHSIADAFISFSIPGGPRFKALMETVSVATPKNILDKTRKLAESLNEIKTENVVPLLAAPYIGKKQAKILADKGISWIDLSGNMLIRVSNQIYIERTGKKNRFPDTAPIKKIFQGTSSLVSRALLLKPMGFSSLYEIVNFINARNSSITVSTVSKVLKSLEEELLIDRNKSLITVIDQEKLLQRLAKGYKDSVRAKKSSSYRFSAQKQRFASMKLNVDKSNYLASGYYAAQIKGMAASDEINLMVKDVSQARNELGFLEPDAEFGNVTLIETKEDSIWFNSIETELTFASVIRIRLPVIDDIGLYFQMMVDTPRGPKVAEILKKRILEKAGYDG